jgi:hypothetical protein
MSAIPGGTASATPNIAAFTARFRGLMQVWLAAMWRGELRGVMPFPFARWQLMAASVCASNYQVERESKSTTPVAEFFR